MRHSFFSLFFKNKTQSVWIFTGGICIRPGVGEVLKGSMRDGLLPGRPWGGLRLQSMWAKPSVTPRCYRVTTAAMPGLPRGRPKHTAEEGIRAQNMNRGREEWPTGDFLRRVKWVLVRPTMWVSEKARAACSHVSVFREE